MIMVVVVMTTMSAVMVIKVVKLLVISGGGDDDGVGGDCDDKVDGSGNSNGRGRAVVAVPTHGIHGRMHVQIPYPQGFHHAFHPQLLYRALL